MVAGLLALGAAPAEGQVLIRVGEPGRATYSEIHEGLRRGSPAADSVCAVLRERRPARALAPNARRARGGRGLE